jgi:hypothetical protein
MAMMEHEAKMSMRLFQRVGMADFLLVPAQARVIVDTARIGCGGISVYALRLCVSAAA